MKAVTQFLRSYPEPMPFKKKAGKEKEPNDADIQELELLEVARLVGDAWKSWGGPSLIIDFETTTDLRQAIRFGVFQLRGYDFLEIIELTKTKQATRANLDRLWHEGIIYSESECKPDEIGLMQTYAANYNMLCMTVDEFITKILYKLYSASAIRWQKIGDKSFPINQLPPLVIGHNLPFDLGRLAKTFGPANGYNYGGLSMMIRDGAPNVTIKKIGFGKHLYGTNMRNGRQSLLFLNTQQLGRAMLGASVKSNLVGLSSALGVKTIRLNGVNGELDIKETKQSVEDYNRPIDNDYILYCRADVETTWQTYIKLRELYNKHGFTTTKENGAPLRPIWAIASEASVGKAYLEQLGIKSFRQNHLMEEHGKYSARFMAGMYGGRTEVNCRLEIRRGMQADFKSQYTTIKALFNLRELDMAKKVRFIEGDGSLKDKAANFLRSITLEQLQKPETWPMLRGAALINPAGCILPVRTEYEHNLVNGETVGAKQIGVNEIVSGPRTWYLFPHIVASIIINGHIPEIFETVTIEALGEQHGLKEHPFFGDDQYMIDPREDDPCKTFIDMRTQIKGETKEGWKPKEQSLKLMASATSYGALVEFTVEERTEQTDKRTGERQPIEMCIYTPHGCITEKARKPNVSEICDSEDFGLKVERPGKWFAPWGALIPAGGQLLLAIAERLANDAGIGRGFCDTDSNLFLIPKGMSEAVFIEKVVGITKWFQPLTPYRDKENPLFALEDVNFALFRDSEGVLMRDNKGEVLLCDGKDERPLTYELPYLLAVSAKRYAIGNKYKGEWIIRKASGHGSGDITAPFYDNKYLPEHPAAPLKDGEYNSHAICKSQAPKLLLDLWRAVFGFVEKYKPNKRYKDLEDYLLDRCFDLIASMPGLDMPQMVQQSICSRDELIANKGKPWSFPFGFYNSVSRPVENWEGPNGRFNSEHVMSDKEKDTRKALLNTSFITFGGKGLKLLTLEQYQARGEGNEGLYRRDNGQFPNEMFNSDCSLKFKTTGEHLIHYFIHPEFKSVGKYGQLKRRKLVILDHVYVGKETSSIIHNVDDEAFDEEEYLNRRISPNLNVNHKLLAQFKPGDMAKSLGLPVTLFMKLFKEDALSSSQMAIIQSCIRVDDNGEASFIMPPPKPNIAKLSDRLRKRLMLLRGKLSKKQGALMELEDMANLIASNIVINPDMGIRTEQDMNKKKEQVIYRIRDLMDGKTLDPMPGFKQPHKFFEDAVARACGEHKQKARITIARENRNKPVEYERRKAKRAAKQAAIMDVSIPPVYWDSLVNGEPLIMSPSHYRYKHAIAIARKTARKMPQALMANTFKVELGKAIEEFGGWFGQDNPPPD
jgi:hypothetical protein